MFALGWKVFPSPVDGVHINIPAGALPGAPEGDGFVSLSEYSLKITWPRWIRRGETGLLRLSLTDLDPAPAALVDSTQIVMVEPALFPLQVDPMGEIQVSMGDDQTLQLLWKVKGEQSGKYAGKLYISFGFFDEPGHALMAIPVAVVDVNLRVIELRALSSGLLIWVGLLSLVLAFGLFILGKAASKRTK